MYICEKCNREFKNNGARCIHQKNCNGLGTKLNLKIEKRKEVCPKCGLIILSSKEKHYNSCNGLGPRRKQPKKEHISKPPWNKGLTKHNNDIIKLQAENKKGTHHTEETKEKMKKRINFGIVKRSKNEIYFAELCQQHFNIVLTNEKLFNGWDADVVIEDIKTAVLWNGKWHYKKIMKKHLLEQVQNRDKIKLNEIKKAGYKPYIIKDMGSYDKEFVEKEFNEFIKWRDSSVGRA